MPGDQDALGLFIDAITRYMAEAGIRAHDHAEIQETAQTIANLVGSVLRSRPPIPASSIPAVAEMAVEVHQSVEADYGAEWDAYSDLWELAVQQSGMQYLGDEWGTPELTDEIIEQYLKPYLPANAIVLEIGCGGGKFSERLACLCKALICGDVSGKMLERTKQRLREFANVRYEKLNGLDLHQFGTGSVDFVFSFDCFVHFEMEDIYCYLQEIRRVLTPLGGGLLHFANLNSDIGWKTFVAEAPMNRGGRKHLGWLRFVTWEIVAKFCDSLNLRIVTSKRERWRDILIVFEKCAEQGAVMMSSCSQLPALLPYANREGFLYPSGTASELE